MCFTKSLIKGFTKTGFVVLREETTPDSNDPHMIKSNTPNYNMSVLTEQIFKQRCLRCCLLSFTA